MAFGDTAAEQEFIEQQAARQEAATLAASPGASGFEESITQAQDILQGEGGLLEQLLSAQFGAADPTQAIAGFGRAGEAVGGLSQQLAGEGDILSQLRNQLLGITTGADDPALLRLEESRLGAFDRDIAAQRARTEERLSRRGVTGSAATNILGREATGGRTGRQDLLAQLGAQRLGRQDTARLQAAGLTGQQAGFIGQQAGLQELMAGFGTQQFGLEQAGVEGRNRQQQLEFEAKAAAIENLFNLAGLSTAQTGAEAQLTEAGKDDSCFFCFILSEVLLDAGEISPELFFANLEYGRLRPNPDAYAGYRLWATPLAEMMGKRRWVLGLVKPVVVAYMKHTAHKVGIGKGSLLGSVLHKTVTPLCWALGKVSKAFGGGSEYREHYSHLTGCHG